MANEFTGICTRYYKLTQVLARRRQHLCTLLANAPVYNGQTNLSDVDVIIAYYRNAQAMKAKMDKTDLDRTAAGHNILLIMKHFEIAPGTILTGIIPGILEYEIYADESDMLHIAQTKNLQPLETNPNIIEIKMWREEDDEEEEEEL
jgi:hypothetical protein